MINVGKFVDETISTPLILRQKVSNLVFEPIILALIALKYFVVSRLNSKKVYCLKENLPLKKIY